MHACNWGKEHPASKLQVLCQLVSWLLTLYERTACPYLCDVCCVLPKHDSSSCSLSHDLPAAERHQRGKWSCLLLQWLPVGPGAGSRPCHRVHCCRWVVDRGGDAFAPPSNREVS